MTDQGLRRPEQVQHAVLLLYLTLGIGVVRSIMEVRGGLAIFVGFVTLGLTWFFIHMISRGKNWARITYLVLFAIGLPFAILPLLHSLAVNPVSGLLGIAQTVMQAVAMVFLFQQASSDWFRYKKSSRALA